MYEIFSCKHVLKTKYIILTILLQLITVFCKSQNCKTFVLSGQIGNFNGKIYLSTGFIGKTYYGDCFRQLDTMAVNGKFLFQGNLEYPIGVRLAAADSNHKYYSGMIFLDSGGQFIDVNIDSNRVTPQIRNSNINNEYSNAYLPMNKEVENVELEYKNSYKSISAKFDGDIPDSILMSYNRSPRRYKIKKILFY